MICPTCEHRTVTELPEFTKHSLKSRGLGNLIGQRCIKCAIEALSALVAFRESLGLCQYCGGEMVADVCLDCGTQRPGVH